MPPPGARTRSTSSSEARRDSSALLSIALLQPLDDSPQVRVQLATGRDLARVRSSACLQRSAVAREFESQIRLEILKRGFQLPQLTTVARVPLDPHECCFRMQHEADDTRPTAAPRA